MSHAQAIVRVLRDGVPTWGRLDGDTVVLEDGGVVGIVSLALIWT
mgnify:CR=1 FL=1